MKREMNTADRSLEEMNGELKEIRFSLERIEELLWAIGDDREEADGFPGMPDPFSETGEVCLIDGDEGTDGERCPGILCFYPGRPYTMIDCMTAMQWLLHMEDPKAIHLEDGAYVVVAEKDSVVQDKEGLFLKGGILVIACDEEGACPIDAAKLCHLVNYFDRAMVSGSDGRHTETMVRLEA